MRPGRRKGSAAPWYGPGMAPATMTPPHDALAEAPGAGSGRPWRVIVRNDDHNTFQGVAFALSSVLPGVSYDRGMELANRIHDDRSGDRLVGPQGARGALLDAARGLRTDHGAARAVAESRRRDTVVASCAVLLALTGYEIGAPRRRARLHRFALVVALVVPRSRPTFPGQAARIFLAICIALFAAQMTAVLALAEIGEADEPVARGGEPARRRRETDSDRSRLETDDDDHRDHDGDDATTTDRRRPRATRSRARRSSWAPQAARAATRSPTRARPGTVGPNLDAASRPRQGGRARDERPRRDAAVRGHAQRAADTGRRSLRLVRSAEGLAALATLSRLERCPSGLRSATGNRVRAERCVAGSNPALSVW